MFSSGFNFLPVRGAILPASFWRWNRRRRPRRSRRWRRTNWRQIPRRWSERFGPRSDAFRHDGRLYGRFRSLKSRPWKMTLIEYHGTNCLISRPLPRGVFNTASLWVFSYKEGVISSSLYLSCAREIWTKLLLVPHLICFFLSASFIIVLHTHTHIKC